MEKKQNFMSFLTGVAAVYGSVILILNIFCLIFGDNVKEYSSIFALGRNGLGVATNIQFLVMSSLLMSLRFLFMTDHVIKKGSVTVRTALMFVSVFVTAVIFSVVFGWFPADNAMAWIMFILSFAVSGTVSTVVSAYKEKLEDKILNVALNKIKEEL